jgi:hypothetical protein
LVWFHCHAPTLHFSFTLSRKYLTRYHCAPILTATVNNQHHSKP